MKKDRTSEDSRPRKKAGALRRIIAVASGSFMLYRAIKKKKALKGLGAGFLILKGATGLGLQRK